MTMRPGPFTADQPCAIAESLFYRSRRTLVFGKTGSGKSTLVKRLSRCLTQDGVHHRILVADPGSPAFGIPGAVCLGEFGNGAFRVLAVEAICSLNAGRFRLPLINAVMRLTANLNVSQLLIDGPGLTRGIAGAELLTGLITAADADTLLLLTHGGQSAALAAEWRAAGIDTVAVSASSQARAPGARQRVRIRTALWDAYQSASAIHPIVLGDRRLLGTPPGEGDRRQWGGRQIALMHGLRTVCLGEVVAVETDRLMARLPAPPSADASLLVRDAGRSAGGQLVTRAEPQRPLRKRDGGPKGSATSPVSVTLGPLTITLVNGIFGDPLVHLRLSRQKRSLLFDLGDGIRLPARIAHQTSDVFITHAHIDHISGFYWLLRARIGELPACRFHGTAGLSQHIRGMIAGIHWDRIEARGPAFDIVEVEGARVSRRLLQVGQTKMAEPKSVAPFDGCLVDDPSFTIHAVVLDHGIPVLALAFQEKPRCHVNNDALRKAGYAPGPWLGELKRWATAEPRDAVIRLPDGSAQPAVRLAEDLIRTVPGRKVVYATDAADSPANRQKLISLARGADLFICEAAYTRAHRHLAIANGHLTARACGRIAAAAGVRRLVPFHLSRRYEKHPEQVFREIRQICPGVAVETRTDGYAIKPRAER